MESHPLLLVFFDQSRIVVYEHNTPRPRVTVEMMVLIDDDLVVVVVGLGCIVRSISVDTEICSKRK
jgi:hypothetical protein